MAAPWQGLRSRGGCWPRSGRPGVDLAIADVEHLAVVASEQRHDFGDDVTAGLAAGCRDRAQVVARKAFEHTGGGVAALANQERRRLATPTVDACARDAVGDVLVHARGVAPGFDAARFIEN